VVVSQDGLSSLKHNQEWQSTIKVCEEFSEKFGFEYILHQSNLGVTKHLFTSLQSIFLNDDQVIVLEDDLQISERFFEFMELGLNVFSNQNDIFFISGRRELPALNTFLWQKSNYIPFLGWALWRESFNKISPYFDFAESNVDNLRQSIDRPKTHVERFFWRRRFNDRQNIFPEAWDTLFTLIMWKHGGFCAISPNNLITYHGNDDVALHNRPNRTSLAGRSIDQLGNVREELLIADQSDYVDLRLAKIMFGISWVRFSELILGKGRLRNFLRDFYVRCLNIMRF
jgi:hypothetical protein